MTEITSMKASLTSGLAAILVLFAFIFAPAAMADGPKDGDKEEKKVEQKEDAEKAEPKEEEGEEKEDADEEAKEEGPKVLTAKKDNLNVKVTVTGAIGAKEAHPIVVKPKQFTTLKIKEVVEHGARVKKGDVLIAFDAEDYEKALRDRRRSVRQSEISLREAEIAHEEKSKAHPIRVAQAEAAHQQAEEDLARYYKIYQDLNNESLERSLKSSRYSLEYAQEELDQLEKMYTEDELTEETEEIVLTRQRRAVESAEFSLKRAELMFEEQKEIDNPRSEQSRKWSARLRDFSHKTAMENLAFEMEKAELSMESQRLSFEESQEKLEELEGDRELLVVRAPCDGVVFYGEQKDGKFNGATVAPKLVAEKSLAGSDAVIMTVVQPAALSIAGTFEEKDLHWMKPGLGAELKPTGYPELSIKAKVTATDKLPAADGKFHVELAAKPECDAVLVGLTCKAEIAVLDLKDTIIVPKSAVKTEDHDGKQRTFVFKPVEDGEPKKQPVRVGKKNGDKVQILDGLDAGQKFLEKCPE